MTWYADLGPIDYFDEYSFSGLLAVGWLGKGQPFPRGEVSPEFFGRLCALLVDPWEPGGPFRGFHTCEFCPPPAVSLPKIVVGAEVAELGVVNLFVPGKGCVYVAPSLIAHYIQAYQYSPPKEFVDAVLRCPEMYSEEYLHARRTLPQLESFDWAVKGREPRSPEYLEALRASGATTLVERTSYWMSIRSGR